MIEITKENAERAGYTVFRMMCSDPAGRWTWNAPGRKGAAYWSNESAWADALSYFQSELDRVAKLMAVFAPQPEQSGWSYDVQTAQVTDANGLKVANDVLPEDAPLIVYASRLRKAAADLYTQEPVGSEAWLDASERLSEVLDAIAAHEQQSVPRAQGARLPAVETPAMALLLFEALEYERAAFEEDSEVDGGDLVEWFAGWRPRVQAALTEAGAKGPDMIAAIVAIKTAAGWFREYADGHEAKGATEKALRNRGRAEFLERSLGFPGPIRIGLVMDGGLIQSVFADRALPGIEVVSIDYDVQGSTADLCEVRQIDGFGKSDEWELAVVEHHEINPVPEHDWQADIRPAADVAEHDA